MRLTWPSDYVNKIVCGDCLEVMKEMKPNSVDAIVCDPPYGLEFMGKEWDKLRCWDDGIATKQNVEWRKDNKEGGWAAMQESRVPRYDPSQKGGGYMQLWHTQWLTEAYRVLKPGGSILVMGGTRTSHRLACAIEDSGFIIKDTLMWLYGSGFPKAQDLGKMIDKRMGVESEIIGEVIEHDLDRKGKIKGDMLVGKQTNVAPHPIKIAKSDLAKHWDGFKVGGIKPAYEPIIWAVKPPEGSYVDNVLKWGVGAVNVDATRIGYVNELDKKEGQSSRPSRTVDTIFPIGGLDRSNRNQIKGRFPANVILSHHPECEQVGVKKVNANRWGKEPRKGVSDNTQFAFRGKGKVNPPNYENPDGYEQVESWDCHPDCAVRLLDEQSGVLKSGARIKDYPNIGSNIPFRSSVLHKTRCESSSGGASRFFYCAKASKSERGKNNKHPTVKPIALFMWLIQLVTREGQIILDPFIGSGTTLLASQGCNRKCIGIEKEKDYCNIAEKRLAQGVI